jgi:O-antigen ligase
VRPWAVAVLLILTGSIVGFFGSLGGAGILACGFLGLCLVRPDVGLAWSFVALPFALPHLPIVQVDLQPFELFLWPAALIALAASVSDGGGITFRGIRQIAPLLVLGGYLGVMSVVFWGERTPLEIRMWGGALFFALTCYDRARNPQFRSQVLNALVTSALMLGAVAILQHFFGFPGFQGISEPRDLFRLLVLHNSDPVRLANLTFDHFNSAGAYVTLLVSVLFAAAMSLRSGKYWLGVLAAATALYFTYSRGAALGALAAMLTTTYLLGSGRVRLAVVVGAIIAVMAGVLVILPNIVTSGYFSTVSLGSRALIWGAYLAAWRSSPVFGLGPGNGFDRVRFLSPYGSEYGAHNNYLYLAADFGIVGLLLVAICLGTITVKCIRTVKSSRRLSPFTVGATAMLAALVVHSLFDDTLVVFSYRVALLAIIAIAFREERSPDTTSLPNQGSP